MSLSLKKFKQQLAHALDDNPRTSQWHNVVDYLIVAMILLSTAEIFISTFDVHPTLRRILRVVDIATLAFFTIEVCLRLWVAGHIRPEWRGLRGRLRYCFSFYGFIDIISTFPFYLQWIFPMPVMALKTLRTARVVRTLRIGRYTKSFNLLSDAIREKRHELIVSMQFLVVITFILSLILYFAEHDAQPDVYHNGSVSVLWAFAQYIGDPGQFAATPPVTVVGRIIACIVGLLGIAIVAVPTGIIGAGFTDAIENRKKDEEIARNVKILHNGFERKLDRPTRLEIVPSFRSIDGLKTCLGMNEAAVYEAVNSGAQFRLVNLAETIPISRNDTTYVNDRIAVEHFPLNRPYGCMIDRKSAITIVAPSNMMDPGLSTFTFYLAYIGGFNYISREIGLKAPYKSFYLPGSDDSIENLADYKADLGRLTASHPNSWTITVLTASGAAEPVLPTNIHLGIGGKKGETRTSGDGLLVSDGATYERFFNTLRADVAAAPLSLTVDHQEYHSSSNNKSIFRNASFTTSTGDSVNHIIMRIEWKQILWSPQRMLLARTIAQSLCRGILDSDLPPTPEELTVKDVGYDGYDIVTSTGATNPYN